MRLPVRIVPAESCPLAFDSRSIPSMTSSLDLWRSSGASGQTAPDSGSVKVRSKLVSVSAPRITQVSAAMPCGWYMVTKRSGGVSPAACATESSSVRRNGKPAKPAPTARRNDRRAAEVLGRACHGPALSWPRAPLDEDVAPHEGHQRLDQAALLVGGQLPPLGHEVVLGARTDASPRPVEARNIWRAMQSRTAALVDSTRPARCCRRSRRRGRCPCPPRWSWCRREASRCPRPS